jgi:hypothetical protein
MGKELQEFLDQRPEFRGFAEAMLANPDLSEQLLTDEGNSCIRRASTRERIIPGGIEGNPLRQFERRYFSHILSPWEHPVSDRITLASWQAAHHRAWVAAQTFRGLGKTTRFVVIPAIYAACHGMKDMIVIAAPLSRAILAGIMEQITEASPNLMKDFGQSIGPARDIKSQYKSFNDRQVVFANGCTIRAVNPLEPIRGLMNPSGKRVDWVMLDDLLKDIEFLSKSIRDRTWRWFNDSVLPAGQDFGEKLSVTLVNSFKHKDEPTARIIRQSEAKTKAGTPDRWITMRQGMRDENGKPVRISEKQISTMEDLLDPIAFRREMELEDASDEEQLFFPDRWPTFDSASWQVPPDRRRPCTVSVFHGEAHVRTIVEKSLIWIDPAAGFNDEHVSERKLAKGDWYATACIGRLALERQKGRPFYACPEIRATKVTGEDFERQEDDVVEMALRYRVDEVWLETVAGQKYALPPLRKKLRDAGFRGRIISKGKPEKKIPVILSSMRELSKGEVYLGNRIAGAAFDQWEAMRAFGTTDHDDIPESVAQGIAKLRRRSTGVAFGGETLRLGDVRYRDTEEAEA